MRGMKTTRPTSTPPPTRARGLGCVTQANWSPETRSGSPRDVCRHKVQARFRRFVEPAHTCADHTRTSDPSRAGVFRSRDARFLRRQRCAPMRRPTTRPATRPLSAAAVRVPEHCSQVEDQVPGAIHRPITRLSIAARRGRRMPAVPQLAPSVRSPRGIRFTIICRPHGPRIIAPSHSSGRHSASGKSLQHEGKPTTAWSKRREPVSS